HKNEGVEKAFRVANHQEGWIRPLQPLLMKHANFTKGEGKPQPDYSSPEPVNYRFGGSRNRRRSVWCRRTFHPNCSQTNFSCRFPKKAIPVSWRESHAHTILPQPSDPLTTAPPTS